MEENNSNFTNTVLKNGLILGIIHLIIFFVLYTIDPSLTVGLLYLLLVIILNLTFPTIVGRKYRNEEEGGYMSFGKSFKFGFFVLTISGLLSLFLGLGIEVLIFPDMPSVLAEAQLENSLKMAEFFGAPEASLEEMEANMDLNELEKQYTLTGRLKSIWVPAIFWAIGGLIIGLFIRKNEPIDEI